jgi:hypothetical protein
MILIITEPEDGHATHVAEMLRGRGVPVVRFNPADFPVNAELSLWYTAAGRARYMLRASDQHVALDELTAVWLRRPEPPVPHAAIADETCREFVAEECRLFVHDVWSSVDALWVPARPAVVLQAQHKASHLKLAGALGFELPATLITTSPDDFLAFYRAHDGRIISKPASTALFREIADTYARYTEPVAPRDLGYADAVRYCPMIFQAYVPKRVELRVTVVGRQVFAAEIHSQASHHTRHDWRHYDLSETPHAVHDLPAAVARRCIELVARLGLVYGAIDMIVTPDGGYVFLEINPSGQYLWIEQLTGLPISEALCDLLIAGPAGVTPPTLPVEALPGGVR